MKEHKHAEVIRAIADGKEVEFYRIAEEEWVEPMFLGITNPIRDPHLGWRIKPEPKPPIVKERKVAVVLTGEDEYIRLEKNQDPNIRFTFDPDTRLPIKVELI